MATLINHTLDIRRPLSIQCFRCSQGGRRPGTAQRVTPPHKQELTGLIPGAAPIFALLVQ